MPVTSPSSPRLVVLADKGAPVVAPPVTPADDGAPHTGAPVLVAEQRVPARTSHDAGALAHVARRDACAGDGVVLAAEVAVGAGVAE